MKKDILHLTIPFIKYIYKLGIYLDPGEKDE